MSTPVSSSSHHTNGRTVQQTPELNRLASCTAQPQTINYKTLTDELRNGNINQQVASAVLAKFIEWKLFERPLSNFEQVYLILSEGRAVSIPVLTLLLRSESARRKFKEHQEDIYCFHIPLQDLVNIQRILITSTQAVMADKELLQILGL